MILAFLATRAGKFAAGGLAVVLAITAFMLWLNHREKAAVEADRAVAAQQATEAQLRAERAADSQFQAVQASNAAESSKTRDAMKEAADANPIQARAPAGAVSRAAADRLRARARGSHPATD